MQHPYTELEPVIAAQLNKVQVLPANTNNNYSMTIGPANQKTQTFNAATLYFRVQTPQGGGTVPADVFITIFVD